MQISQLKSENASLTANVKTLQTKLAECEEDNKELIDQVNALQTENMRL